MKKLTLTFIGNDWQIEDAEANVRDFLGNCPDELKTNITVEEIDYQYREEHVVVIKNREPIVAHSLEKALQIAMVPILAHEVVASDVHIAWARVSYLDGEYDGVNEVLNIPVRMKNIV